MGAGGGGRGRCVCLCSPENTLIWCGNSTREMNNDLFDQLSDLTGRGRQSLVGTTAALPTVTS